MIPCCHYDPTTRLPDLPKKCILAGLTVLRCVPPYALAVASFPYFLVAN